MIFSICRAPATSTRALPCTSLRSSIEGSAIATGFNTIWVDREDPFWAGFQVVDGEG